MIPKNFQGAEIIGMSSSWTTLDAIFDNCKMIDVENTELVRKNCAGIYKVYKLGPMPNVVMMDSYGLFHDATAHTAEWMRRSIYEARRAPRCECGGEKANTGHSHWCDMHWSKQPAAKKDEGLTLPSRPSWAYP